MKTFLDWLEIKENRLKDSYLRQIQDNLKKQPVGYSLHDDLFQKNNKINDPDWNNAYRIYLTKFEKFPKDPKTKILGNLLLKSFETGDMTEIKRFNANQKFI